MKWKVRTKSKIDVLFLVEDLSAKKKVSPIKASQVLGSIDEASAGERSQESQLGP